MRILVSADDFGLSEGITTNILDAVDHGAVTNVSIIANGTGFEHAICEYRKRRGLYLTVHLNLMEGRSLSPAGQVPDLVDERGYFRHSFQSLCLFHLRADKTRRAKLRDQVRKEFRAQLARVAGCIDPRYGLRADSHLHVHMIPFVFDTLMELHEEFQFEYVRCLAEPFFLTFNGPGSLRNYAGLNIAKHAILNTFSRRALPRLRSRGIPHCRHFIGVLFTGNMREAAVASALAQLENRCEADELVEILLHPGGAAAGEERLWSEKPAFRSVYYSDWRTRERSTLKSPAFRALVEDRLIRQVNPK
ncbi:MAG: ChbG/HpnK family deacetylase [Deltaproteobacteria bacterium]|nr:ChbG/HpnK family deacetylase [Deltaproteobacteria bacterium]